MYTTYILYVVFFFPLFEILTCPLGILKSELQATFSKPIFIIGKEMIQHYLGLFSWKVHIQRVLNILILEAKR